MEISLMQHFLQKGWLSRKFFRRGRQMYKPKLSQCCFALHKHGGQAHIFSQYPSLVPSVHNNTQRHKNHDWLHSCRLPTPVWTRHPPSPLWNNHSEGQLAPLDFLWTPSLRLQPALLQKSPAGALGGFSYRFNLHNDFCVLRWLGDCMRFIFSHVEPET